MHSSRKGLRLKVASSLAAYLRQQVGCMKSPLPRTRFNFRNLQKRQGERKAEKQHRPARETGDPDRRGQGQAKLTLADMRESTRRWLCSVPCSATQVPAGTEAILLCAAAARSLSAP
eukprot:365600-Chlamydomonas_euryale.AAC.1